MAGSSPAVRRRASSPALVPTSPEAAGCSFSSIWLNSEYGSCAPGWAGGAAQRSRRKRGRGTALHQALADAVAHKIVQERAVPEAHLGLRRMHVDVHLFGVALQKQQRERIARGRHQVVIRRGKRVQHQAVADQAAVDENVDRIAIRFLNLRPREKAGEPEAAERRLLGLRAAVFGDGLRRRHAGRRQEEIALAHADLHQLVQNLAAENLVDALLHAGDRRHPQQFRGPAAQAGNSCRDAPGCSASPATRCAPARSVRCAGTCGARARCRTGRGP